MTHADGIRVRRATVADGRRLGEAVIEGVAEYPSFAPPGWTGPSLEVEHEHLQRSLADEDVCCLVVKHSGELVGQITVRPGAPKTRACITPRG
jgi:hypothetical protein